MDIKVLALKQAKQAAFITWLVVAYADDLSRITAKHLLIELFDFFLVFLRQCRWHEVISEIACTVAPLFRFSILTSLLNFN